MPIETDYQQDVYHSLELLLDSLAKARLDHSLAIETREANDYLYTHLINYKGMLQSRPLNSIYEFMIPRRGQQWQAGWYWRHPKHNSRDYVNWHGPFTSRKAAIEDRLRTARRAGAPTTSLEVLEREIFAEAAAQSA